MQTTMCAMTGQQVPVKALYNDPLTHSKFINGVFVRNAPIGKLKNNEWAYVNDGYGNYSINVVRADYCMLLELEQITILDSIGNKPITKRLARFIDEVAPTLVFKKFGRKYRIYLKKVGRTFDIKKVVPAWTTTATGCNYPMAKHYHNYNLAIDIDSTFYVKGIM